MTKFKKTLCFVVISCLVFCLCSCGNDREIKFGAGNKGGVYYKYASVLNDLDSTDITVKETAGSQANLRLLRKGFVDMAIVQSDVLSEAVNGTGDFEDDQISDVRAAAGLYMETFQIIVPANSYIQTISDLENKRVSVGEDGSGVAKNAEYILNSAGLTLDKVKVENLTYSESADALKNNKIDAFFAVVGAPSEVVENLSETMDIRLLSLDDRTISYMTNLYKGYYKASVKAGTYKGQNEDVTTVGVKAVLVAHCDVETDSIKKVLSLIFENKDKFGSEFSFGTPDLDFATSDIPCAFHKGASEYYKSAEITVGTDSGKNSDDLIFGSQDN